MEGFTDISAILRGGIYALSYRGQIVYIGKADKNLLARIAAHRSAAKRILPPWFPVQGIRFDQVHIRHVHPDRIDAELASLIIEHRPRYNIELHIVATPNIARNSIRRI